MASRGLTIDLKIGLENRKWQSKDALKGRPLGQYVQTYLDAYGGSRPFAKGLLPGLPFLKLTTVDGALLPS
jgi:hypothetical protein